MKDYGLVSVIIPTYNREKTIVRAAKSVLNQTYKNIELLIVDDCSTDNTEKVVKEIGDSRIRFFKQDENQGACVARNRGIDEARGVFIGFQDSDDEWMPKKLEVQLKRMESSGADVCICRMSRHSDAETTNTKTSKIFPKSEGNRLMDRRELCNHCFVSTQMILAKSEVFREHRFDPLVKKTQDYDWTIRASRNHTFYYANEVLVKQYLQSDSLTFSGHKKTIESRRYFLKKYRDEFKDDPAFEIFQLRVIARNRAMLGERPVQEFKRICKLNNSITYKGCLLLSKLGLIKYIYLLLGYRSFED